MQRVAVFFGLVFAFASLFGVSLAHAHRYQSLPVEPLVVLNHVDANNVSIPVYVKIQQFNIDLGSGLVMPCGWQSAVTPSVPALPVPPKAHRPSADLVAARPHWPQVPDRRPPRAA